jgi:DNA repair exonuclease SbcCD ATPase subunit
MNTISTERRRRAEETKAEIERLKAELAERDEEIERLHDETVVLDTDRVWDLEQQVAALRRELVSRSGVQQIPSSPAYEWTRAARDPYSDDLMEPDIGADADVFGESTRAELVCSTPTRRMRASFPTPPDTSPEPQLPQTPCRRQATPQSSPGVQAALPDPEKQLLQEELEALQLEVDKLTTTLESYSALTSRLSDKLTPFSRPPSGELPAESPDLEAHVTTVLQTLFDRKAALAELDSSLKSLGFPGSDAFEVIESLRSGLRSARLELEYLAPGEVTLPLTGSGAGVLDLVLVQLRNFAKKARDADNSIDEYHAIELSLRQQLSARVTAMDSLADKLHTAERSAHDKDARITDLEVDLARLKHTTQTYTRDISELESLVERVRADLTTRTAELSTTQTHHHQTLAEKTATITTLEAKLATALAQTTNLQSELTTLSTTHASTLQSHTAHLTTTLTTSHNQELTTLTTSHATSLAERDARLASLQAEMERVGAALQQAQETVQRLRGENARLEEANGVLVVERKRAEEVVEGMRGAWERVVRMGEGFLGRGGVPAKAPVEIGGGGGEGEGEVTTLEGSGKVGRGLVDGDLAEGGRGNKRRKYDSGLGFLDEEDVDGDA